MNQLSEGSFERGDARRQRTPRSPEATRLHDAGRWVQALSLDPRPLIKIPLQPLDADRPIGQSMRWQNREGQAARTAQVALDAFLCGAFRVGKALVSSVPVRPPRTTARTDRTQSSELIFAQLNRRTSPKSSRLIKPL